MNFSAASSSSSVVIPGRAFDLRTFIVRTRMSPAAAIWSTCSGVLRMIIWSYVRASGSGACRVEDAGQLLGDRGGLARAVDALQDALVLVIGDERLGLLVI